MHAFRQSEDKIIVEFQKVSKLFNTCASPIHFDKYSIRGNPREHEWINRDKRIADKFKNKKKITTTTQPKLTYTIITQMVPQIVISHSKSQQYRTTTTKWTLMS